MSWRNAVLIDARMIVGSREETKSAQRPTDAARDYGLMDHQTTLSEHLHQDGTLQLASRY
jgi:hypothetical protein